MRKQGEEAGGRFLCFLLCLVAIFGRRHKYVHRLKFGVSTLSNQRDSSS